MRTYSAAVHVTSPSGRYALGSTPANIGLEHEATMHNKSRGNVTQKACNETKWNRINFPTFLKSGRSADTKTQYSLCGLRVHISHCCIQIALGCTFKFVLRGTFVIRVYRFQLGCFHKLVHFRYGETVPLRYLEWAVSASLPACVKEDQYIIA